MYSNARQSRLAYGFGGASTTADAELHSSLTLLRNRSRQMVRDSAYARRAKTIIVNNVVGTGVPIQGMVRTVRGNQAQAVNDDIEWQWHYWTDAQACHTGGVMHFYDLERAAMGQVFEAGEVLVRLHLRPFGNSRIPLALELIEPERLADHADVSGVAPGNELRMGVEVDQRFHRPVAYWLRERGPGDLRGHSLYGSERIERVPADQVLHLKLTTRWPQTRGEPWLAAVLRKLDDINEYSHHELSAAKAGAAYFASLDPDSETASGGAQAMRTSEDDAGQALMDIEPLSVFETPEGYKLNFHSPNRPNSAFAEFMRAVLREVASGCGPGISYQALSGDASQATYSSQRVAMLDERDGYRAIQQWWVRAFREPLHRVWLRQAVLSRAITAIPVDAYAVDPRRYEQVRFKLRGWSWVDPTKEVAAFKEAIKGGFTTVTDVIAQTAGGMDIEDVLDTRKRELQMMEEAGLSFDTDAASFDEVGRSTPQAQAAQQADPEDAGEADGAGSAGADGARLYRVRQA